MKKMWDFFDKYTSTVMVLSAFLLCVIYTVVCLYMMHNGEMVSDTLTEWVFKFFGLELISLAGIKVSKHLSKNRLVEEAVDTIEELIPEEPNCDDLEAINEEG